MKRIRNTADNMWNCVSLKAAIVPDTLALHSVVLPQLLQLLDTVGLDAVHNLQISGEDPVSGQFRIQGSVPRN